MRCSTSAGYVLAEHNLCDNLLGAPLIIVMQLAAHMHACQKGQRSTAACRVGEKVGGIIKGS